MKISVQKCIDMARQYEKFPPDTVVDMSDPCNCAAGVLGKKKFPNYEWDAFYYGAERMMRILAGCKSLYREQKLRKALLKLGIGHDKGGLFSESMGFYSGDEKQVKTTAGVLAYFWRHAAEIIRRKK